MIKRCFIVFWFRSLNHICLVTRAATCKFFNKEIVEKFAEYRSLLYEWLRVTGEHLCVVIH